MNYLDKIALAIYQQTDTGEPCEEDWPLYRIYAVLALAKGADTTLKDVHDAWAAWKSPIMPEHRSLVPFDALSPQVQELDREYCDAIRIVGSSVAVKAAAMQER